MPRRSLPVAMTDHASTQAPKKKRRAARKIASTAARKRTKAKTKAYHGVIQPLLQLPAPRPLLLLTYVGPSRQIGSSAIAINSPRPIKNPSAPQIIEPGRKSRTPSVVTYLAATCPPRYLTTRSPRHPSKKESTRSLARLLANSCVDRRQ